MAFSFDVTAGIPRLNQSGVDNGLTGIATAINALPSVERSTTFATSAMRKPPIPNGMWYRCSTSGTSAAVAPTYNSTLGSTTTDGTSVWTAFLAPDVRTLGTQNHYYMPQFRFNITGQLTNANPQAQNFTCWDLILSATNASFTSGQWASDGVTPLYDGLHLCATRVGSNGADESSAGFALQLNAQCTFIGGEVQVAASVAFATASTPRSYQTRWRNTKDWGGVTSSRFRSNSTTAIFRDCEFFDMAFDLFRMPAEFSVKARGSEYLAQYVGAAFGGADAKFVASNLENVDGIYDFDNFASGWVELYNCKQGQDLRVVTQHPSSTFWVRHCVPLYQDLIITAKDTAGVVVPNVRFTATENPSNPPTVTFTTAGNLKVWDFRNPTTYQTTTNASGIATSTPVLNVWYWQTSFKESLRFPSSTAVYQGRAYNFKTTDVSILLGASSAIPASAGMISLDTATTVDETTASAITGISLVPSGATGGVITISSNKSLQDIWNYYRWWISQFANRSSNDTWTCIGGILDSKAWTLVVNSGVTLTGTTEISQYKTSGTVTNNGTITAVYGDINGTSTIWEFGSTAEPILAGTSLAIYDGSGVTKYFNAVTTDGVYRFYIAPQAVGATYTYAIERYGYKREEGTFPSNAGGILFYVPSYGEDVGITDTLTNVQAYTTLTDTAEIYDATANFRLSETGIKLGQLVARDGTYLDFGNYNVKFKDDNASIISVASGTITYKAIVINESTKYNAMKATPPKTILANDTEIINVLIEDANGDSQITILGGASPFSIYKFNINTTNFPTGIIPDTRTDVSNFVESITERTYRFLFDANYNYFVYSPSIRSDANIPNVQDGQTDWEVITKGSYSAPLYKGNEIQLASDAPQLVENNQKLDELILKIDTDLDVPVSTRLAAVDYVEPHNTEIDAIKVKVDTLTNYDDTTTQTKLDSIQNTVDNISVDFTPVLTAVDALPTLAEIEASTILAKEATSQSIKTKVDTLNNYDDAVLTGKVDALPTLTEIEASTVLASKTDVETAKNEIIAEVGSITVDNVAIGNEVWNQEPERLKNVATVETTGEQFEAYKS